MLIMLPSLNAKHIDPLEQTAPYGYSRQNTSLEPCCNSGTLLEMDVEKECGAERTRVKAQVLL